MKNPILDEIEKNQFKYKKSFPKIVNYETLLKELSLYPYGLEVNDNLLYSFADCNNAIQKGIEHNQIRELIISGKEDKQIIYPKLRELEYIDTMPLSFQEYIPQEYQMTNEVDKVDKTKNPHLQICEEIFTNELNTIMTLIPKQRSQKKRQRKIGALYNTHFYYAPGNEHIRLEVEKEIEKRKAK